MYENLIKKHTVFVENGEGRLEPSTDVLEIDDLLKLKLITKKKEIYRTYSRYVLPHDLIPFHKNINTNSCAIIWHLDIKTRRVKLWKRNPTNTI